MANCQAVHGGGADVADLAGLHDVVEGFHGLFDGGFVVPAMDLVEVDVVGAEALEALVEFEEDLLCGRGPWPLGSSRMAVEELGGDDGVFAFGVGFEEAAEDLFAGADGVDVGGVEEVDAEVEGLFEEGLAVGFVERPGVAAGAERAGRRDAVGHAAEADAGDFEAGFAEIDIFHADSLGWQGTPLPLGYFGRKVLVFNDLRGYGLQNIQYKWVMRKILVINELRAGCLTSFSYFLDSV